MRHGLVLGLALTLCATTSTTTFAGPPRSLPRPSLVAEAQFNATVYEIQKALNARGYNAGPSDGLFGATTGAAIRDYQRDNNLLINGQSSDALLAHIQNNQPGVSQGQKPNDTDGRDDGARREQVIRRTQKRLDALGYSATETGTLDWQTRLALRDYQRDNNLAITGDLDRELAQHIRENAKTKGDKALSPNDIARIENGLKARGYDVGAVDGHADDKTRAAVRDYQRDRGVTVDGELDQELADMLAEGVDRTFDSPEVIADVQAKLNALGYTAGPADGVMGPATRTAIQEFRSDNDLASSTTITQSMLDSFETAKAKGDATTTAGATDNGAYIPGRTAGVVMRDDFEDGDFESNPTWRVFAGQFQVRNGFLSVKLAQPGANNAAEANNQQAVSGFLRQALGVRVPSQEQVAAISQGTNIPNAFKIELTLLGSAKSLVQMHLGPYVGNDLTTGYRLVFDQESNNRIALVRRTNGQTEVLIDRTGVTELGDGSKHNVSWVRETSGRMTVSLDDKPILRATDANVTGNFDGFSFVNLAGAWNMHDITIHRYR